LSYFGASKVILCTKHPNSVLLFSISDPDVWPSQPILWCKTSLYPSRLRWLPQKYPVPTLHYTPGHETVCKLPDSSPGRFIPKEEKKLTLPFIQKAGRARDVPEAIVRQKVPHLMGVKPRLPVRTLSTEPSVSFLINHLDLNSDRCAAPLLQGTQHSSTVIADFILYVCSYYCQNIYVQIKCKSVPLQAWSVPEGSRKIRFPDYVTMAQDGDNVVSLTHRPLFTPRKYS